VVKMLDVTEISAVVAAAGVLVGVVYYILEIRHQSRMRQTEVETRRADLLARLYSTMTSRDWLEAWDRVMAMQTTDLTKLRAEHGLIDLNEVLLIFDELGVLLQMRLVDVDLVEKMFHGHVVRIWKKMMPIIDQVRESLDDQRLGEGFEYLYNEIKKYEQKLQQSKAQ